MSNYQIPDFVSDCTYESSRQTGYAPPRLNPKNPDIIQHSVKLNWVETCFLRRNIHSIANACQDPNLSAHAPPSKMLTLNRIILLPNVKTSTKRYFKIQSLPTPQSVTLISKTQT